MGMHLVWEKNYFVKLTFGQLLTLVKGWLRSLVDLGQCWLFLKKI